MCDLFKNVEENIKFEKGDLVGPDLLGSSKMLYTDDDYYVVVSNYAWYARDVYNDNTKYEFMNVHQKDFDYKDVFMFGGWKSRVRNIKTGKYKFFKQDDIVKLEDTYLELIPGAIRDIKFSLII
jgi:hypothetical protein